MMTGIIQALSFYLFAALLVGAGAFVVAARNPVYAVLALIVAFFNAAGLMVLMGAEFIAMMLVIVYVGAVAVLFLFVVMMLDIGHETLMHGAKKNFWPGFGVATLLVAEAVFLFSTWKAPVVLNTGVEGVSNTAALGSVLYTQYFLPFQTAGFILLAAMIGAIVLTLRDKKETRRQKISAQVGLACAQAVELHKVEFGKGVEVP